MTQTLQQERRVRFADSSRRVRVLQEASQKDGGDTELALQRHLELPDDFLREQDDDEVRNTVHASSCNVGRISIETVSGGNENVPILLARFAEKGFREEESKVEREIDPYDSVNSPKDTVSELSRSKGFHIKKKDRKLDTKHGKIVHD